MATSKVSIFLCYYLGMLSTLGTVAAAAAHFHAFNRIPRWCCLPAWRQLPGTRPHTWSVGCPMSSQSESGSSGFNF